MDHTTQRRAWVPLAALLALACALLLVFAPLAARADATAVEGLETVTWDGDSDAVSYDTGTLTISGDGTLTLTADTEISGGITFGSGTVTIDLAGYTLTYSGSSSITDAEGTVLTVTNGTLNLTPNVTGNVSYFCTTGSLTLSDLTVTSTGTVVYAKGGTVVIDSCTITTTGVYVVATNATTTTDSDGNKVAAYGDVSITITDSRLTADASDGDDCTVMLNVTGSLTIENSTITGDRQAVVVRAGEATITDSTITVTGDFTDTMTYATSGTWQSGNEVPAGAVIVGSYNGTYYGDASCTLTDCTVTVKTDSDKYYAIFVEGNSSYEGSCTVYGCDTSVTGTVTEGLNSDIAALTIYGGDFSDDSAADYLATASTVTVTDEDGNETTVEVADVISVATDEGTEVHALVAVEAVDATCTTDGNVAYYYCAYCGELFVTVSTTSGDAYAAADSDDVTVAATGHSYESEVTTEPTCTEEGVTTYTCTACGDTYTESVAATGHTAADPVVENLVAATEAADGSYDVVVYCATCGEELYRASYAYASSGHDELYAAVENVVEATETEDGSYDVVVYCAVCGEEVSRETVAVEATGVEYVVVYRLYNPYSGEHLYTTDSNEYETLVGLGWTGEGVAWLAPESGSAVYRLYNPYTGDHHYTTDLNEYSTLAGLGWVQEGVAFYSADEGDAGVVAVYRLYNPYAESFYHLFTTDSNEYSVLAGLGWEQEGLAFYGLDPEYYGLGE